MITIKPFQAIFPKKKLGKEISTRQLNSYSEEEIEEVKKTRQNSFLNIIQPKYHSNQENQKEDRSNKYLKIRELFETALTKDIFTQSKTDSFYIYRQKTPTKTYIGIIGGASTKDYQKGKIKKHEHTLEKREKIFTKYLRFCGFNAEPVLLIHKKSEEINNVIKRNITSIPLHSFTSNDNLHHDLWEVNNPEEIKHIEHSFSVIDKIYIADGHHRIASSSLFALEDETKESTQNIMALFMCEENISIFDYNRVVKNTIGISEKDFYTKINERFNISKTSSSILKPTKKHQFSIYLNKKWSLIELKNEFINKTSIIAQLDSQIITDYILSPILDIHDLKNDNRIDFFNGTKGLDSLKSKVDSGKFDVAIAMFPISFEEVELIADKGLSMPPKSTWVEPKLRSGLTIYKF